MQTPQSQSVSTVHDLVWHSPLVAVQRELIPQAASEMQ
jgi:hypothetical protein